MTLMRLIAIKYLNRLTALVFTYVVHVFVSSPGSCVCVHCVLFCMFVFIVLHCVICCVCLCLQPRRNAILNETMRWTFPIPYILTDSLGKRTLTHDTNP